MVCLLGNILMSKQVRTEIIFHPEPFHVQPIVAVNPLGTRNSLVGS